MIGLAIVGLFVLLYACGVVLLVLPSLLRLGMIIAGRPDFLRPVAVPPPVQPPVRRVQQPGEPMWRRPE